MLQEEDQRKAYLHLMTNFIMEGNEKRKLKSYSKSKNSNRQKVKYMISRAADGEINLSDFGYKLYNSIKVGMPESKILQLSSKICIERGYVLKNDVIKKLYIHLKENTQIWVELTQKNITTEPVITEISNIELKTTWKVYHNNILKVLPF